MAEGGFQFEDSTVRDEAEGEGEGEEEKKSVTSDYGDMRIDWLRYKLLCAMREVNAKLFSELVHQNDDEVLDKITEFLDHEVKSPVVSERRIFYIYKTVRTEIVEREVVIEPGNSSLFLNKLSR